MIGGREYTFGVSGKLHANSLIMYDHQTESLWSHLLGRAVTGKLAGANLRVVPALQTTWGVWRSMHPDTLVLHQKRSGIFSSLRDPYASYYLSGDTGIVPVQRSDSRVAAKAYVIGVRLGGSVKAYPFPVLNDHPVVNDEVAATPIVVTFLKGEASGAVFDRRAAGATLTFEVFRQGSRAGEDGVLQLRDQQTKSLWHPLSGKALSGPLAGTRLTLIPTTQSFWFGWVDHYPETAVYAPIPKEAGR